MRTPLINALADRLGTSPTEARVALAGLLQHTRTELKQNRPVHLPRLGTFRTAIHDDQSGRSLTFDPDPAFSDAVNESYADLAPLTLTPARPRLAFGNASAEPASAEPASAEEKSAVTGEPSPAAADEREQRRSEEKQHSPERMAEPEAKEADDAAADGALPERTEAKAERETPPKESERSPKEKETPPVPAGAVDGETADGETADSPAPAASPATASSTAAPPSPAPGRAAPRAETDVEDTAPGLSSRRALPWLLAAVVLVAIGIGAWLLSRPSDPAETPPDATAQVEEPPAPADDSPADASASESAASQNQQAGEAPADQPETPAQTEEPPAPQAPALDPAQGGWTLVVSSKPTQEEAQAVAEQFAQRFQGQNAPIGIIPGAVEGTTYYRVGVGQFGSSDDALRALDENSRYPDDAWLLQLSPDS